MNEETEKLIKPIFEKQAQEAALTSFLSPISDKINEKSKEEKIRFIAEKFYEIMTALGLDLEDESLVRTPYRVAKMYVEEIFSGLETENFPEIRLMEDRYQNSGEPSMVFVSAQFTSFCEHHFVPMVGHAYVAYIPNGKLIGLSKIPRIVKYFAKRPQIQERLTAQIADSLATILQTEDVAVSINAQHFCVMARGVENQSSRTQTQYLKGAFSQEGSIRYHFFEAIQACP